MRTVKRYCSCVPNVGLIYIITIVMDTTTNGENYDDNVKGEEKTHLQVASWLVYEEFDSYGGFPSLTNVL